MKKRKLLTVILTALCLSACSLFNDDDIAVSNKYNPPVDTSSIDPNAVVAGGVVAIDNAKTPNAYCFKNIAYGENGVIKNTYANGQAHANGYNPNGGEDYTTTRANNNFDLYVPKSLDKAQKHTAVLFIHGGAWVSGFKSDVNEYVHEFANKGYITATIKYKLMKRSMDDNKLSLFRDLDEIDACIKTMKNVLDELEFDTTKTNFVIGGASSGAHLAMLYSYSRGNECPLPIKFIINAVGPVDIKPENWKKFNNASDAVLDAGITASAINTQKANGNLADLPILGDENNATWNEYQTLRIANGMCGLPYTLSEVEACTDENKQAVTNPNAASTEMTKNGGGEDQVSITYWMNNTTNKYPMVCAYAGRDSVVGIAQFAKLQTVMDAKSITYDYVYFKESDHAEITKEKDETAYNQFVTKIEQRLQNI